MGNLKIKTPDGSWAALATQEYVNKNKPNWNAKEGEPGYIEGRTHYQKGYGKYVINTEEIDVNALVQIPITTGALNFIKLTNTAVDKATLENNIPVAVRNSNSVEWECEKVDVSELSDGDYLATYKYKQSDSGIYHTAALLSVASAGDKSAYFESEDIVLTAAAYLEEGLYFGPLNGLILVPFTFTFDYGEPYIKTLNAKFLPESAVQVSNPLTPGVKEEVIMPLTSLEGFDDFDSDGIIDAFIVSESLPDKFELDQFYNVNYNGITYKCPALVEEFTEDGITQKVVVLGNLNIFDEEMEALYPGYTVSSAPFMLMAYNIELGGEGIYGYVVTTDLKEQCDISISKVLPTPQWLVFDNTNGSHWEERPFYEIEGQGALEVNLSTVQDTNISFSPYIPNTLNGAWPLIADFVPSPESFKKANITIVDASGVKPITDRLVFQIGDDYIYNIVYDNDDENESPYIGFVVCSTAGDKTELIKQIYPSCERAEVSVPGIYVEPWPFILEASTSVAVDFGTHVIKTLDPKFLPETVVQAEPLAKGEVILEETALEIVEVNPGEHEIVLTTPWKQDLVVGRTYTITYNGQAYICEAVSYGEIAPGLFDDAVLLGNLTAIGMEHPSSNPNAPFVMLIIPNALAESEGTYGMFVPFDSPTEVVIAINGGANGVPQWLVADSKGNIKWEERTHWVEKAKGESFGTIEKLNVVGDYAYSGPGTSYYGAFSPFSYRPDFLNVKELYIVLDGQEYYSKAISDGVSTVFGNEEIAELSFGNKDFTAPFVGILLPGNPEVASGEYGAVQLIMPEDTEPVEHTVEVYSVDEYVHKLDPKFIDFSAIETEQFWYPILNPETPVVLYENNNITLSYQDLYGNGVYTYNVDTINIGLNTVNFNYRKLYTLVADGEEFIASVSRSPLDMDIGNTNVIIANNPATGHSIVAYCPPSGTGILHSLQSNFDFTSLVIKDAYSATFKIPGQLVEGTTALDYGTGFGSVVSTHGGAIAGNSSFAFGNETKAEGTYSFAFGLRNTIKGDNSFAFGPYLYVRDNNQFTVGRNAACTNDNKYPFVVANGDSMAEDGGKNIHALAWTGDAYHTGDVYVQGDGTTAGFDGAKKVATEEYVTEAINAALAALGLPTPTTADAGKILRVNAEGKYELVSP